MLHISKPLITFFFLSLLPFYTLPACAQAIQWASDISLRPLSPKAGEVTSFQVRVKAGKQAANGFTVVGGIDGKQIFRKELGLLKAERSRNMRFKWRATGGSHEVYFKIVPTTRSRVALPRQLSKRFSVQTTSTRSQAAQVQTRTATRSKPVQQSTRSVRQSMHRSKPVQASTAIAPQTLSSANFQQPVCEGTPLPDIEITHISISGSSSNNGAGGLQIHIPYGLTITVVNRGQCDSGRFTITATMRVQGQGVDETTQLGTKGLNSLQPCRTKNCSDAASSIGFSFTPRHNFAFYEFNIEADAGNYINEFNEENNELSDSLRITEN
ncbi:CARDB domain-containing protein [Mariprofundus micogutta]|nr:CARDB domain-containing protein [Mariprofundus micogutta]